MFPGHPEIDESALIEATARHTGLALKEFAFDERASILAPALTHIARWRLPPASPNLFVWEPVMACAREMGVDVMLDGEGGDELFGRASYLIADMLRSGRIAKAWSLTNRIEMGSHLSRRLQVLRNLGLRPLIPLGAQRRRRRRRVLRTPRSLLEQADALAIVERYDRPGRRELDGPMWWRSLADQLINGGELHDVSAHLRRESIAAGVDQRHPFSHDLDLVLAVLTNPPQLQFDPLRDRALLRDALTGHIPEAVRTRHAKSYFTPLLLTALVNEGGILADDLARRDAPIRAYLRGDGLDRLVEPRARGISTQQARRLWQVGIANAWLRAAERPEYLQELQVRTAKRPCR